ncbi:MAG: hypothetical protein VZR53_05615 [Prevotella sp.]|nr:hypothetical protein [Prevotella sp.]
METIKSYTDIERSKVLAEILPLDSADYFYKYCIGHYNSIYYRLETYPYNKGGNKNHDIPCWSLAALLNVLPKIYYPVKDHKTDLILGKPKDKWCVLYWDTTGMQHGEETLGDNPVDACVDMIVKLKEKNMI